MDAFAPIQISIRHSIFLLLCLFLVPANQAVAQTRTWDMEGGISDFEWSNTTGTQYFVDPPPGELPVFNQFLGPLTSGPLVLDAIDIFLFATPYTIAFDLMALPSLGVDLGPSPVFRVTSHGQILFELTSFSSGFEEIGQLASSGDPVFRMYIESLISPGPIVIDPLSGCCGDVLIEFEWVDGISWGIDNVVVVSPVPEPGSALLVGFGLIALARRRPSTGTFRVLTE